MLNVQNPTVNDLLRLCNINSSFRAFFKSLSEFTIFPSFLSRMRFTENIIHPNNPIRIINPSINLLLIKSFIINPPNQIDQPIVNHFIRLYLDLSNFSIKEVSIILDLNVTQNYLNVTYELQTYGLKIINPNLVLNIVQRIVNIGCCSQLISLVQQNILSSFLQILFVYYQEEDLYIAIYILCQSLIQIYYLNPMPFLYLQFQQCF